ncbi:hypothetical protein RRG08_018757 [Elysia crispata]|uniref:Uncharacterized protein n=1 Tax=Elysia crispata TaxID=231223 RepID=A0AAE0Z5M5_9GAST|nr:hypothetical protein RRG08_018757 [Elysia crispata]
MKSAVCSVHLPSVSVEILINTTASRKSVTCACSVRYIFVLTLNCFVKLENTNGAALTDFNLTASKRLTAKQYSTVSGFKTSSW